MLMKIFVVSLLLFSFPLARAQDDSGGKGEAALVREAAEYSRNGLHAEAAKAFKRAVAMDPQNVRLLKDYMWSLWYSNQAQQALAIANRILALSPNNLEALNMIGRSQEQLGNPFEAKRVFEASLRIAPNQLPIVRALGRVYDELKEYDRAIRLYQDFLDHQPDDAGIHAALGRIAYFQGRYQDSVREYTKALEISPDEPRYRFAKAQSLYYSGSVSEAIVLLKDLVKARPIDWRAVQLLVSAAYVNKNIALATSTLEDALKDASFQDAGYLLQLAEMYRDTGMPDQFLLTINRLLNMDPQNGQALLDKARFLEEHGNTSEAIALYREVTQQNPGSAFAWQGVADTASISSRTATAVDAINEALKLDPTDPEMILAKSMYVYQNGGYAAAKEMLLKWLDANPERTLAVLLYHGVVTNTNDPLLAAPINVSVRTLNDHLSALKQAGYQTVTVEQAIRWFKGEGDLPRKAVLLTFDDDRLDSFVNGDPLIRQHGDNAVMFAPIYNVDGNLPGFANWDQLRSFQSTGRWQIQAHGDLGHTYIVMDEAGRKGLFLPNRMWLDAQKRLETPAEWEARVRADHEGSKRKIFAALGKPALIFAWPEGDYGQFGIPNYSASAINNLRLCREAYSLCFTQNEMGINVRSRDPARIFRVEPRENWTGQQLVDRLADNSPFVRIRRQLMLMATWEGRAQEAYEWLNKNAEAVSSKAVLLADEAIIHRDLGDYAKALSVARESQAMQSTPSTANIIESMQQRSRYDWTGTFVDFNDNQTRHDTVFRQTVGSLLWNGNTLRLSQFHGDHSQDNFPHVQDNGLGMTANRPLSLVHDATLQVDDHVFTGGVGNTIGISTIMRSRWADFVETEVGGGKTPYEFASAIDNNVQNRFGDFRALFNDREFLKVQLHGTFANLSDTKGNRATGDGQISIPLIPGEHIRLMGQTYYDNVVRSSLNYYSPEHLREFEVGLNYEGDISPGAHLYASYLPGFGRESTTKYLFIQVYDFVLKWDYNQNVSLNPEFWVSDTPTYNSTHLEISVVYKFSNPNAPIR